MTALREEKALYKTGSDCATFEASFFILRNKCAALKTHINSGRSDPLGFEQKKSRSFLGRKGRLIEINMLEIFDKSRMLVPIRAWVNSMDDIEENCLLQAINLASLPFAHHHIALMPDTHTGKGMPIGGVIACKNVVILITV